MRRRRVIRIGVCVLAIATVGIAAGKTGGSRPFTVSELRSDGLVVSYRPLPPRAHDLTINNVRYREYAGTGYSEKPGWPHLPVDVLTVGIPPGSRVEATLVNPVYETTTGQLIAPTPAIRRNDDGAAVPVYAVDAAAYGGNAFLPAVVISVGAPYSLRGQHICPIRISPLQYNPATRVVRRLVSGTLQIRFLLPSAVSPRVGAGLPPDPRFAGVLRTLLLNYDQARAWREAPARKARIAQDSTRDWFQPGKTYLRIPVASDGWYTIRLTDLAAAGVSPSQVNWNSIAAWSRGRSVPFVVRSDSSVNFYAFRNYGDSTYYDFYTDTSTYWLTWNDPMGRSYTLTPQPGGIPAGTIRGTMVDRHFEQNLAFYVGTGDVEIGQNEPVPGRGWVWEYYYPGTTISHTFDLDTIDAADFPTATLRLRLFSTTPNYASDGHNHKATFWVNDSLAGSVYFAGRSGGVYSVSIPVGWLKNGENTFVLKSDTNTTFTNQFYLDWFEIDYGRYLHPVADQLRFTVTPSSPGLRAIVVDGFSSTSIDLMDPDGGRIITGGTVNADGQGGYTLQFQDTLSGPRTYVAVARSAGFSILPAARKTFTDIRSNGQGADYIIISHGRFLQDAQQLASQRRAVNGVRTAVVDVQDIYDEFNYGVLDAMALKNFLSYAYQNWPAPQPLYLMMFGGASWDFHHYLSTTVKTNFVPAYGIPSSDNWFVCFSPDTPFVPSMFVGRFPVQNEEQAQQAVNKIIGYDGYTLSDWNKNFMFITGGLDTNEQKSLNALSDNTISTLVQTRPIGGSVFRAYKAGLFVIDGTWRSFLRDHVRDGLVFMNYLGHSGGRVWSVDIGPPDSLENTNGKLPFVTSVSCNVGAFAEPSSNVLAEDFVLANNSGAIGVWSSAALGYPYQGQALVNHLLEEVTTDSLRDFGSLTTLARIKLWQDGANSISISDMNLTPLLGDPLSRLALPVKPDLAITPGDIAVPPVPVAAQDTVLPLRLTMRNYGLVPDSSVQVTVRDLYAGKTTTVVNARPIPSIFHIDSMDVSIPVQNQAGRHVVTVVLDPFNRIDEVSKTNNAVSVDEYVYASSLSAIRPLNNAVVAAGPQRLVVSRPPSVDTTTFQYLFQLDTVATFDSPFLVSSGPVNPLPVSGEWTTPSLGPDRIYFWKARTVSGITFGSWTVSAFITSALTPALPVVRWAESTRKQLELDDFGRTIPTDTGVILNPNQAARLYVRSLGYRANANKDYYSIFKFNEETFFGLWWVLGNSFMGLRINQFSGTYDFNSFNVQSDPAQADSMAAFIQTAAAGSYIAFAVIYDGATNVNANLKNALKGLGSTLIDSLQPGDAWSFIGRKGPSGPAMQALEHWSRTDIAVDSLQIPNYFSIASGSVRSSLVPMASRWLSFHWRYSVPSSNTSVRIALLGMKDDGTADTLRSLSQDSTDVSLGPFNQLAVPGPYVGLRSVALLNTADAQQSPVLQQWWLDSEPPADLAIGSQTVGLSGFTASKGTPFQLPVTIYNLGYRRVDSARVNVHVYDQSNTLRPVVAGLSDSIAAGGSTTAFLPVPTTYLSGRVVLHISVAPVTGARDLSTENNAADYAFMVTGSQVSQVRFYANGVQLMDGDYIAPQPTITVGLPPADGSPPGPREVEFYVDNVLSGSVFAKLAAVGKTTRGSTADPIFSPTLTDGSHDLGVRIIQPNLQGGADTLEKHIAVQVLSESRILQVLNYPNPFSSETSFTFILTGSRVPDDVTVRIFTVAGRKIRELHVPSAMLQIGFNRIPWDGRDNDGDEIANGYYLYQIQTQIDGKADVVLGKMARVR